MSASFQWFITLSLWLYILPSIMNIYQFEFVEFKCCEGSLAVKFARIYQWRTRHPVNGQICVGCFSVCLSTKCLTVSNTHFNSHLPEKISALLLNCYFLLTTKWSQIKHTGLKLKLVWSKLLLWSGPNFTEVFLTLLTSFPYNPCSNFVKAVLFLYHPIGYWAE